MERRKPKTRLCRHFDDAIYYRERNLAEDLLGRQSFTAVAFEHILGRTPSPADSMLIDAVMVALMEHGFTPSAIAARLTYLGAPESLQAAVAAGLLGVGSQFVGTMENCAAHLSELIKEPAGARAATAKRIADRHRAERRPVPGFGHHLHRPDDPRAARLLALLRESGRAGPYHDALLELSRAIDEAAGKHITINATGASAAVLAELGVPVRVMRGFALIARTAGLVAHLAEEQQEPAASYIWDRIDHDIPYDGKASR